MSTRTRILEAAMRLTARDGLLSLTLDRVAEETGLSKGGVTYHFRSKQKLLMSLVEYFGTSIEQQLIQRVAEDKGSKNRWVRAALAVFFPDTDQPSDEPSADLEMTNKVMMSIVAAAIHEPEVVAPIKAVGERLQKRLLDDNDGDVDQVLSWLVLDGLFLWELVGLITPESELYQRVIKHLKQKVAED